jgi:hypothetical protein
MTIGRILFVLARPSDDVPSLAALNPRCLEDAHEPNRSRLPGCQVQLEHLGVDVLGGRAERCRLPWLALGESSGATSGNLVPALVPGSWPNGRRADFPGFLQFAAPDATLAWSEVGDRRLRPEPISNPGGVSGGEEWFERLVGHPPRGCDLHSRHRRDPPGAILSAPARLSVR